MILRSASDWMAVFDSVFPPSEYHDRATNEVTIRHVLPPNDFEIIAAKYARHGLERDRVYAMLCQMRTEYDRPKIRQFNQRLAGLVCVSRVDETQGPTASEREAIDAWRRLCPAGATFTADREPYCRELWHWPRDGGRMAQLAEFEEPVFMPLDPDEPGIDDDERRARHLATAENYRREASEIRAACGGREWQAKACERRATRHESQAQQVQAEAVA